MGNFCEEHIDWNEIKEFAEGLDSRPTNSMFAAETPDQKMLMELDTAREWAKAVKEKYGREINNISHNPLFNNPPDCFGEEENGIIDIELTELVKEEVLAASKDALKKKQEASICSGYLFRKALWDQKEFEAYLAKRIQEKREKYKKNGVKVDVLVIHTDETYLSAEQIETWLPALKETSDNVILSAYLLIPYPSQSDIWSVYKIF